MKQKFISQLVCGALGLVAVGSASAGVINATQVNIAREAIVSNSQNFGLPEVSYKYTSTAMGGTNGQQMQVQIRLPEGLEWGAAPSLANVLISGKDTRTGLQFTGNMNQTPNAFNTTCPVNSTTTACKADSYFRVVGNPSVNSSDKRVVYVNLDTQGSTAVNSQGSQAQDVVISISGGGIAKMLDYANAGTAGADGCTKSRVGDISYAHISNRNADGTPTTVGWSSLVNDESLNLFGGTRPEVFKIADNLNPVVFRSASNAKLDLSAAGGNGQKFATSTTSNATMNTNGSTSVITSINNTSVVLGGVYIKQVSTAGTDKNGTNAYVLNTSGAASALTNVTTATLANGTAEWSAVKVVVTPSSTMPTGSTFSLCTVSNISAAATEMSATNCVNTTTAATDGTYTLTWNKGLKTANSTLETATSSKITNSDSQPLYVIYTAPGTTSIPSASFKATATLVKATDSATDSVAESTEADVCSGNLSPIGGGVKIDVRNYVPSTVGTAIIRLINNSETQTAVVSAQWIDKNGQYGNYGDIATLAPRAAINMFNSELESKLVNVSAITVVDGVRAVGTGLDIKAGGKPGSANGRVRISANKSSIRVQNYFYNNNVWSEWSSAQGAEIGDDVGSGGTSPSNYGTATGQDARLGIEGAND